MKDAGEKLEQELQACRLRLAELERELAESRAQQAETTAQCERYRRLCDATLECVVLHDKGLILDINLASEALFGLSRDKILGAYALDFAVPEDREGILANILSGREVPYEAMALRPDGKIFPVELHGRQIKYQDRVLRVTVIRDITERKRTEEELERMRADLEIRVDQRTAELSDANRQLTQEIAERRHAEQELQVDQQMLRHLLAAHERNQRLTAYEIHDGLVQDVTGALMHFEALEDKLPPAAWTAAELPLRLLRRAIAEGRRLISGLRPPIIDEQGVAAAIEYLVGEEQLAGQLQISLEIDVQFERLEPLLESTIFRIVQESLANIRQHSRSPRAALLIRQTERALEIHVEDWGIGFDPAQVSEQRFGVRGIRERARLLGGRATVESQPGQGTKVRVELPM